jgi:hypothetical protein
VLWIARDSAKVEGQVRLLARTFDCDAEAKPEGDRLQGGVDSTSFGVAFVR